MVDEKVAGQLLPRLKKIEGQVRGLAGMVERRDYCIDILQQVMAVRGALKSAGLLILGNHIDTCVRDAMRSAEKDRVREKVEELLDIYEKFGM
jgi:DNA-binding FrmR family transcriptional regulator